MPWKMTDEDDDYDGPWPEGDSMTKPTVGDVMTLVTEYGDARVRTCGPQSPGDYNRRIATRIRCEAKVRAALEALAAPHKADRWNIDVDDSDGSLLICKGEHDKDEKCETVRYVPASPRPDAPDLYWKLHGLSKLLEGRGRIDEDETPDAYSTILDAMALARGPAPTAPESKGVLSMDGKPAAPVQPVQAQSFDRLAGRGMHELRFDELTPYVLSLLAGKGQDTPDVRIALDWIVSELERKTNDERALAVKLDALRGVQAQGEPVYYVHADGIRAMPPEIYAAWAPTDKTNAPLYRPVFDRPPRADAEVAPQGEIARPWCHYSMLPDHICNKCGRIHGYSHPPRADAKIVPIGPREPDMTMVICPACTSQFRAIPVEVQEEVARLRAALEKIEHEANQPYIQRIAAAALKGGE